MAEMKGSQAIVEALKRQKVKCIFGLPGGAIMDVYDVLYDSDIRHILVRHEQEAAHMADGYARASGLVGVCMATSGPGATNLVTGIATAYMDSSPVVALTGQVANMTPNSTYMIGRDAFQEADIVGVTAPITKYNFQLKKPDEIPAVIKKAFYIASTGRPGPVLVDLPRDTQRGVADMFFPDAVEIRGYRPRYDPDPLQVKAAIELLTKAERPMVLAGGGVIASGASQELLQLVEFLNMPVAYSLMGKGSIPEDHPLSIGMVGMHGCEANKLILEADVLLAVGLRFSDRTTGTLDQFCPDSKIIHIDIDPTEVGKNIGVDVSVVADAKRALQAIYTQLTAELREKKPSTWRKRIQEVREQLQTYGAGESGLKPKDIITELRRALPRDAIVTTEVGQNQMWAAQHFKALNPRTFITSGGLGTMGFGFPAAIGAKVAKPDVPVVDIAGDGSFIMTEQSLVPSVIEKIPVAVVILNNSMLGMVAQWQRLFYNRRYAASKLGQLPDFTKLAEAYGAEGVRVETVGDFSKAIRGAIRSEVTTVVDIPIRPEENVFPMVPAGKGLRDTMWG